MGSTLSVIICSHNPRLDALTRALQALKVQTLSIDSWSLLLIDNASQVPLEGLIDLSWHPAARLVREPEMGLTPARLRGISEAESDVLIFVDDDNVLDPTYLETALGISSDYPMLGAWGGSRIGEFEVEPERSIVPFLDHLALRSVSSCVWSNLRNVYLTTPIGAGLCIRRTVGLAYARALRSDPIRTRLDRVGKSLASAGDIDLAMTACDIGLGTGLFPTLSLLHLIPKQRLQREYLLKLIEEISYSGIFVKACRERSTAAPFLVTRGGFIAHLFGTTRGLLEAVITPHLPFAYQALLAKRRGERRAFQQLASQKA